ncbi:hypothetical protein KCU83_g8031, partial [Aureobasidium melanogenum]
MPLNPGPDIYLIRHGEKPPKEADGRDAPGLSAAGLSRAQALVGVFGKDSGYNIRYILAEHPKRGGERERPYDTIRPLAESLGDKVEVNKDIGRDDAEAVAEAARGFTGDGNVLICWEHGELTQIAEAIGVKGAIEYPDDRFDVIWKIQSPYMELAWARLSKGVILEACENVEAEYIAKLFLRCFYRRHGLPAAIVSDRGSQFVNHVWKRLCQLLRIQRRLSTAYHPQTDWSTERANAEVETLLRQMVNHSQDDWTDWLPAVEFALNGRMSNVTGTSPFFLSHGYHVEPLQLSEEPQPAPDLAALSPVQQADMIAAKIKNATEWTQSAIAEAQQEQERQANRHRNPSPAYKTGDKVWLNLKNVRTDRPSKKLEDRQPSSPSRKWWDRIVTG